MTPQRKILEKMNKAKCHTKAFVLIYVTLIMNSYLCCDGFTFTPTIRRARSREIFVGDVLPLPTMMALGSASRTLLTTLNSTTSDIDCKKNKLSLLSPCKINLFLRIERKRPDGYHDLASLFQAIGLGDTLHIELLPSTNGEESDDIFTCNMEGIPTDRSNLVLRAVDLMRKHTGFTHKVRGSVC